MAKINIQPDCGNSPRKLFLKELTVALVNGDIEFFTKNIQDKITWEIVGHSYLTGKENYLKAITAHNPWKVKELTIDTIITHGPDAAVSGKFMGKDKSIFVFCDIFRFKGAGGTTINSIKTFLIKEGSN